MTAGLPLAPCRPDGRAGSRRWLGRREAVTDTHRLPALDVLRAVAILLVFTRHAAEVFLPFGHGGVAIGRAAEALNFGGLGVTIFFAVSGFLIPSSLHGPTGQGTLRYVLSRVFRLYPAFLVSLVPSAAAHFWLMNKAYGWREVAWNLTMVPRLFGVEPANGAYWTLEVEVAFYLLCLALFLGGVLQELFCFAAITLTTFLVFQSSQQPFFGGLLNPVLSGPSLFFNLNIAVMCWGAVFRGWWDGRRLNALTLAIAGSFLAFWTLWRPAVFVAAALGHRLAGFDTNILAGYSLALAIFVAVMLSGLRVPVLRWVGRISYSFYLLHGVVIHVLQYGLNTHMAWRGYHNDLYMAAALGLTLALSQLSFVLVERPGIRLGRRLTRAALGRIEGGRRVGGRGSAAAVSAG